MVIALIGLLMALVLPSMGRAKRAATRTSCENQLRQFYGLAVAYADEHEGVLDRYENILKQISMVCPEDGAKGVGLDGSTNARPSSYRPSPFVFQAGANMGVPPTYWLSNPNSFMLMEHAPFHDPTAQKGKRGRYLTLNADGSVHWAGLDQ